MKLGITALLLLTMISCSHKAPKKDLSVTERIPASASFPNLDEFIKSYSASLLKKEVPVGQEVEERSLKDGTYSLKKKVFIKQNKHGYFYLLWDRHIEGDLFAQNFTNDPEQFEANIRHSVDEGRITSITVPGSNVFEMKSERLDSRKEKMFCTLVFDFNGPLLRNESCVNAAGALVFEIKEKARKIDLVSYEHMIRDTRLTICSNMLSNSFTTTCEQTRGKRDWWKYLFERKSH